MSHTDIHLSKSLSWLLRHGACQEGFDLSPQGFLEINKILQHPRYKDRYTVPDIVRVVEKDAKNRYSVRENPVTKQLEIKANQGHSIVSVTVEGLKPVTESCKYPAVIHGTYFIRWEAIKSEGLSRMLRNHIHFAKAPSLTIPVDSQLPGLLAIRQTVQLLIFIDLEKALADGLKFYESENGVILTSGNKRGFLKPQYFLKVVSLRSGEIIYP